MRRHNKKFSMKINPHADEYCIFDIPTKPPYCYPKRPSPNPLLQKEIAFFLLEEKNNAECRKKYVFAQNDLLTKKKVTDGQSKTLIL